MVRTIQRHSGADNCHDRLFAYQIKQIYRASQESSVRVSNEGTKEVVDLTHPFANMGVNSLLTQSQKF